MEYIEVTREVGLHYRTSELMPPVSLVLEPLKINEVPSDVWAACLDHNAHRTQPQGALIEQYIANGTIRWFPDDGKLAQAKVDGVVPFATPQVDPLQAAAQTYAAVKDAKGGADAEAEAQDTAILAAEKALETSG